MVAGVVSGTEHLLRRAIADKFEQMARGARSVVQEAATGEEKETDLRQRSKASDNEAVIEPKLADNGYTVAELRQTVRVQLVGRSWPSKRDGLGA